MAVLRNRAGHYIFALWLLLLSSSSSSNYFSSFPRLISAVADWMSAILPHNVALVRLYDAGLKRVARGSLKIQDAKGHQKSPSGQWAHHRTNLSGYIFATKAAIDNRKKNLLNNNIFLTCLYNIVNSAY